MVGKALTCNTNKINREQIYQIEKYFKVTEYT